MRDHPAATRTPVHRALFVATILTGSFLLFLIQPMVARMALPRLGGAPNVWNSAMLVYQALLLAGYFYAHRLSRMPVKRQAMIHIGLLLAASITLPIGLATLPPPKSGEEALWVPLLFLASIGPVFFLVSAQAPMMQRWFLAHPNAGEPWALYAASNLGSFAGLIAYPLVAEPLLRLRDQSMVWSIGYGILIVCIAFAARVRWQAGPVAVGAVETAPAEPVPAKRILHWLALAAVPSGLMLSTTSHLTTDLFAMPLLWVIPLGIYLLSFVAAFSDKREVATAVTWSGPLIMLLAGGMSMVSRSTGTVTPAMGSVALLFVVAVSLHGRMYELRPAPSQLTLFYLSMSAGGALGGLFTALIAPMVFDWVWEHPILVFAAAALMPLPQVIKWQDWGNLDPVMAKIAAFVLLGLAAVLSYWLSGYDIAASADPERTALTVAIAVIGVLLVRWQAMYLAVLLMLMLALGGLDTIGMSLDHSRTRSYFGVYTVRDYQDSHLRSLAHGTTLHGWQSLIPARSREPLTYYGPGSGVAIGMEQAQKLYGEHARIGVVGLGTGTLACYKKPGEDFRFFEIDPAVLRLSRNGTFTFVRQCAPDAKVVLGDARIELARMPKDSLDVLAVDAFSSDAIPLHLLTDEAVGVYLDRLGPRGLLLVHISNRFFELEPVLSAIARKRGLAIAKRDDNPQDSTYLTPSTWVAISRDPAVLEALAKSRPDAPWGKLMAPAPRVWTDDHASILPYVRWQYLLRRPT
jgi:hypothetical protein